MYKYALVESGQISEMVTELPHCWRNISGLDLSKDNEEFLNSVGWYTIENAEAVYNHFTHKIENVNHVFENNKVSAIYTIVQIPEHVHDRETFLDLIRQQRNLKLQESDWTQYVDVVESHSTEWNNSWKIYRQKLRDLMAKYNDLPAIVPSNTDIDWPTPP